MNFVPLFNMKKIKIKRKKNPGRGGARPGAGRPEKEPTVVMRVPASMADEIKTLIEKRLIATLTEKHEAAVMA